MFRAHGLGTNVLILVDNTLLIPRRRLYYPDLHQLGKSPIEDFCLSPLSSESASRTDPFTSNEKVPTLQSARRGTLWALVSTPGAQ